MRIYQAIIAGDCNYSTNLEKLLEVTAHNYYDVLINMNEYYEDYWFGYMDITDSVTTDADVIELKVIWDYNNQKWRVK